MPARLRSPQGDEYGVPSRGSSKQVRVSFGTLGILIRLSKLDLVGAKSFVMKLKGDFVS